MPVFLVKTLYTTTVYHFVRAETAALAEERIFNPPKVKVRRSSISSTVLLSRQHSSPPSTVESARALTEEELAMAGVAVPGAYKPDEDNED
jgi:hypothetical protein